MTSNRKGNSIPAQELSEDEANGLIRSLNDLQSDLEGLCRHGEAVRESVRTFAENVERHFRAN